MGKREWAFWAALFIALAILFLVLKQCQVEEKPAETEKIPDIITLPEPKKEIISPVDSVVPEKEVPPPANTPKIKVPEPKADTTAKGSIETVRLELSADTIFEPINYIDTLFVYADPWGGRHFDSAVVSLHCRENCPILYSFGDSVNLKSYYEPLVIRRSSDLWIAGINETGEQSRPVKVQYIIERKSGNCAENMVPYEKNGKSFCMDVYEWPNKKGENIKSFVNHEEAASICEKANKRLCSLEEWQLICKGPEKFKYPYGNVYNENYCPAKEKKAVRSGRFPACRSYFGNFDLTGNVWEWTSTISENNPDHYLVAGGNWSSGNQASCEEAKYSFYPQNKYLFVGFRCCRDMPEQ